MLGVQSCRRGKAGRRRPRDAFSGRNGKRHLSLAVEREVKKMGHPVTTNPLIIMLINMSIVFAVLIGLSVMIRLIHLVDPTKEK